jgi:hypothetical protein
MQIYSPLRVNEKSTALLQKFKIFAIAQEKSSHPPAGGLRF